MMMNFLGLYACRPPAITAILQRSTKVGICSVSLALIVFFTLTPALAGDVDNDQGTSRGGFLHCAQTEADAERLSCFDRYMRLAGPDISESLGPVAADLTQCANLVQSSVRAACFDAAANEIRISSNGAQLHDEVTADPIELGTADEPRTADLGPELGQEQLDTVAQKTSKTKDEKISATVIDLNRNAFGLYSFRLDNGQVWQQTEIERFVPPDNDFLVEIRRGAISGYRLRIQDRNKILRVKRLQ